MYNIEKTLEFLPYISWGILAVTLLFVEIKNWKETLILKEVADPSRGGFIPPSGDGYEYYVSNSTIVYILHKSKNRFRVYLIQGSIPNVPTKQDKYGAYFNIRCKSNSTAEAEKIIDTISR